MAYQQKNPLRKDLLNGRTHVYYLSDSGLSRLCVNFETLNVFATYNSLPEVAHLWKHPTEEIARLTAELVTLLRTFWAEDAE